MYLQALKAEEKQRYLRQLGLPQIGNIGQEKLKHSTVCIAGLGGLGSASALYLAAAGIGRLRTVDRDRVDASNLKRQILHTTPDVGRLKTESALETLRDLNPYCDVIAINEEIINANARDLVGDADIIVDATDNLHTRRALNLASLDKRVPFIYGGINGWLGTVSTFIPGQTACFECLFHHLSEPATPPNVIGPVAALVGSIQSVETIKWILKAGPLIANQLLTINTADMTFKKSPSIAMRHAPSADRWKGKFIMPKEINIIVNGFNETVPANTSVDELIVRFKEMDKDLIVERNGRFVHARDYLSMTVQAGDELEFIHPNFGG